MTLFDLSAVLKLDTSQFESGVADAGRSMQGLENKLGGLGGALGKAQQGFTVFKGVLSNVLSGGINALAGAIRQNLGSALSRVDTLNNYRIVMEGLGKDGDKAEASINRLAEGINGLPTTLDSIASTQQQFVALGESLDDATKLTLALNNATLAGGQGQEAANSAMNQWYQMIANGKSDMGALQIINQTMPAQLDAIAKSVVGADANWKDLDEEWKKNPEITEKVKQAIVDLNEEGIDGTKGFAEQAKDATKGIQTSMQNMQTAISRGIANILDEVGQDRIAGAFQGVTDKINDVFGGLKDFVANIKEFGFTEAVRQELEKLPDVIDQGVAVLDVLPQLVSMTMSKAKDAFTTWTSTIDYAKLVGDVIQGLANNLPKIIESIATFFSDTLAPWIAENGADIVISLGKGIVTALPVVVSAMGKIVNGIIRVVVGLPAMLIAKGLAAAGKFALGLLKGANKVATAAGKWVSGAVKGLASLTGKLAGVAAKAISSFVGKIASGASNVINAAKNLATGAVNAVKNGFANIGDVGMNLVRGIWNGISAGYDWITGQIRSWVGNVKSFIKNLFGINSPSKWARDVIGKGIDEGMALGIMQNTGLVDDALEETMPDVSTLNLLGEHAPTAGGKTSFSYPVFNNEIVVNGAEDPESWANRFMNRLQMEARMA